MNTVKELLDAARAAVLENKLDEAEALKNQAVALKSIEDLTPPPAPEPEPQRLPFGDPQTQDAPKGDPAVKSWYQKKFGELPLAAEQIAKELYSEDYSQVVWAKNAEFRRFLRTGYAEDRIARQIVLSPTQIMDIAAAGLGVGEIKSTMIEANDELGGFLVPEDFRTEIISRLPGLTVVRPLARVQTTSRDRVTITKRTGGDNRYVGAVRISWVDESPTAGAAETNATYGQAGIPVHVMMGDTPVSKNLLEDSAFNLPEHLSYEFTTALAVAEDEVFLLGSGAGQPQGILKDKTTGGPWDTSIEVVNSGTAAALTATGIAGLPFGVAGQYRQNGAVFVFSRVTAKAISQLTDTTGRPLFRNDQNPLAGGPPNTLEGYGYRETEAMGTVAANYYPIIFGDFSGYRIVDRIGMSLTRYDDSQTAKANSVVYVMRRRVGGQVTDPWKFALQKISA